GAQRISARGRSPACASIAPRPDPPCCRSRQRPCAAPRPRRHPWRRPPSLAPAGRAADTPRNFSTSWDRRVPRAIPRLVPPGAAGEERAYATLDLAVIVGLLHQRPLLAEVAGLARGLYDAGRQDDPQARPLPAEPLGERESVDAAGQVHVAEHH